MTVIPANFLDPFERQEAAAIFKANWGIDPLTADKVIEENARRPSAAAFVARSDTGAVLGFAIGALSVPEPWFESVRRLVLSAAPVWIITEIHVAHDARKKGVGTALLQSVEGAAPYAGLAIMGVDEMNAPARRLYRKAGWTEHRERFTPPGFTRAQVLYQKHVASTISHPCS